MSLNEVWYKVSVITPTWKRHRFLLNLTQNMLSQVGVKFEHIIVSDGHDNIARSICDSYAAKSKFPVKYEEIEHRGNYGDYARTKGLEIAKGEYVVFFDDDNSYFPHAVTTLYAAACNHDIGICLVEHWDFQSSTKQIIGSQIAYGQIDTACYCVKKERAVPWTGFTHNGVGTDYHWIELVSTGAKVNLVPIVVASHLIEKQHPI